MTLFESWIESIPKEKLEILTQDKLMLASAAFTAGCRQQYSDGRPYTMDEFVSKLFVACDDSFDRHDAIDAWLHGDWNEALSYLEDPDCPSEDSVPYE